MEAMEAMEETEAMATMEAMEIMEDTEIMEDMETTLNTNGRTGLHGPSARRLVMAGLCTDPANALTHMETPSTASVLVLRSSKRHATANPAHTRRQ